MWIEKLSFYNFTFESVGMPSLSSVLNEILKVGWSYKILVLPRRAETGHGQSEVVTESLRESPFCTEPWQQWSGLERSVMLLLCLVLSLLDVKWGLPGAPSKEDPFCCWHYFWLGSSWSISLVLLLILWADLYLLTHHFPPAESNHNRLDYMQVWILNKSLQKVHTLMGLVK